MKEKKPSILKVRNWYAVSAHFRSGAGKHKDKSKYSRKIKHKSGVSGESR